MSSQHWTSNNQRPPNPLNLWSAVSDLELAGIVPPLVTPLTATGDVDVVTLRVLAEFVLEAGVHGLFVLGSSGEAPYLTDAHRHLVVKSVVEVASGQVPVLVGVIDTTASRVVEHARSAGAAGARAVVVAPPFYALASDSELIGHFAAVRDRAELPVVAYDIPSRTGRRLGLDVVAQLAHAGVICGLKDSSNDIVGFRKTLLALSGVDGFAAMVGSELMVDIGIYLGAAGAVPGLANVDPHGYVRVHDAARRGDWETARAEQARLAKLFRIIELGRKHGLGVDAAAYGGFKAALTLRGVLNGAHTMPPQGRLPMAVHDEIKTLLVEAGLL